MSGLILDPVTGRPTIAYDEPRLVIPSLLDGLRGIGILLAGLSDAVEKKILDHLTGKTAYTSPAPLYLALTTVAVLDSDTSASITEANYTGYARIQIPAGDWNAATGTTAAATNANQKLGGACTAGTSTVIGWALSPVSSIAGAGDITHFGTCTSTVISTTQTPPTINAGALSIGLD
jgi:hypothetical protein